MLPCRTHRTCQLHALSCALADMTGVDIWVISVSDAYEMIQNEDCGCIRCGDVNDSGFRVT